MNLADELNPKPITHSGNPPWDGNWRWTECIGCPAAVLHRAMGCPTGGYSAETLALFYEGILHENDLKSRLRLNGHIVVDYPDGGHSPQHHVYYHPDGQLWWEKELLETKSFDDDSAAEDFIQHHPAYEKQVQGYLYFEGLSRARILAKNRSSGWILDDIVIDADPSVIQAELANLDVVYNLIVQGATSCQIPWAPSCSKDFLTRLFCPYNGVHCKADTANANQTLDAMLQDYAPIKLGLDQYEAAYRGMRMKIQRYMEAAGLDKVASTNQIVASLTRGRLNRDVNYDQMKQDGVYKQYVTESTGDRILRISLPKGMKAP